MYLNTLSKSQMNIVLCEIRSGIISVKQRSSLGIQWCGSVLREHGYENVFIQLFEGTDEERIRKQLVERKIDVFIIEFRSGIRHLSYRIIEEIKKINNKAYITLIGHDATLHASKFMEECEYIDIVIYGEAELTALDLCNKISNEESLDKCEGIFYRKDKIVYRNNPRNIRKNLDYLSMPALDIAFSQFGNKTQQTVFVSTRTSRGCLGNCAFCSLNRLTDVSKKIVWRGRELENVVNEIEKMQEAFNGKRLVIEFVDNSFEDPDSKEKLRINKLMNMFEERKIKIAFAILTRTESWTEADIPLINKMRENGLYYIAPGVEKSTEAALKRLNKRATVDSNERIFKLFSENGIFVHAYMIMFDPYVTFDELRENAKFIKKNNMSGYPFNWYHSLGLHPDTEIFQRASRDGLIKYLNNDTFFYEYQFTDGRIDYLFKLISKMSKEKSVSNYMNLYEVTRFEEYLYSIWKIQYDYMLSVEKEMENYIKECHYILNNVGNLLYNLFMEMVDSIEENCILDNEDYYFMEWNNILKHGYEKLEYMWKVNNITLLRKKIKLL